MNKLQRKKLKRKSDLKLIFFTFTGAFIIFFIAFTFFLPILTPKVEIPALSEDYVLDSITSQDFRDRIDPRLHSIELQEITAREKTDNIQKKVDVSPQSEPVGSISNEDRWTNIRKEDEAKSEENEISSNNTEQRKSTATLNVPPRPKPVLLKKKMAVSAPAPVFSVKVVVGDFSNPKEVKIASDILSGLNFEPFIRERNGKYILQVASFSDSQKAQELVNELKDRNFDAKIIYE